MFALNWFFSIDIWTEEIKLRLEEGFHFGNWSISKLKTFSAFSNNKIMMQESKQKPFNRVLFLNCRAFDWHVDGRIQTGSYTENQVWKLGHHENQVLKPWYNQNSDARNTFDYFFFDWFVTTEKRSIGTVMQQVKPVESEKLSLNIEINRKS